jgi:hypothetical protein
MRLLVLSVFCTQVLTGTVPLGGLCASSTNHLDPNTQSLLTQCTEHTFCTHPTNGTCAARLCRRDEFPFGYMQGDQAPPLCPKGSFCPDEGSGCQETVGAGMRCQFERDEQCAPPVDWEELGSAMDFNGSICLKGVCMWVYCLSRFFLLMVTSYRYANVTLGQPCVIDDTAYNVTDANGQWSATVVTRDNCRTPTSYCETGSMVCESSKALGVPCLADHECGMVCMPLGFCMIGAQANIAQLWRGRRMCRTSRDPA